MVDVMSEDKNINISAILNAMALDLPPEPVPLPITDATSRFCPLSLEDWINVVKQSEVPYVSAELITELNRWDCLMFESEGEHQHRLYNAFQTIQQSARSNHMIRYDFCSSSEVKYKLSVGFYKWIESFNYLIIDDPRSFDLLFEYPRERIPVWRRPWIDAKILDNYPVEYRVFICDGKIQGISNYYLQRPLPCNENHLNKIKEYTNIIIDNISTPFLWNIVPYIDSFGQHNDILGCHCTVDYIVDKNDNVLFLEGGPPHELGAHPCCFKPYQINGIALTNRNAEH